MTIRPYLHGLFKGMLTGALAVSLLASMPGCKKVEDQVAAPPPPVEVVEPTTPPPTDGSGSSWPPAAVSLSSVVVPEDFGAEWPPAPRASPSSTCAGPITGSNSTINVGPGLDHEELTTVPWLTLVPGDVVNIYYRPTPYRTKIGLRAQGTISNPVVINGVTDSDCNRPILSGENAVMADDAVAANFGSYIQWYGLILIHRLPSDSYFNYKASNIWIQNLQLVDAKYGKSFTALDGSTANHDYFSAAIYATRIDNLKVENCEITRNGLGVFTNTMGGAPAEYSSNVIIRRNNIHTNGNVGRQTEHNLYVQARRALYEGNTLGQVYGGSTLKDRSSGTVIRFNKIYASARLLDLVETEEDSSTTHLSSDPLYPHAWVYGNLMINDSSSISYAATLVHWGYDNNGALARTGTLFFYGNTVENNVLQSDFWYTNTIGIDPEAAAARVEGWSNIFWNKGGNEWRFMNSTTNGSVALTGTNYLPTEWYTTVPGQSAPVTTATVILGDDPLLSSTTFAGLSGSPVLDHAEATPSFTPTGITAANLRLNFEYAAGIGMVPRTPAGAGIDLGAVEGPAAQ